MVGLCIPCVGKMTVDHVENFVKHVVEVWEEFLFRQESP